MPLPAASNVSDVSDVSDVSSQGATLRMEEQLHSEWNSRIDTK
jgi:hypothetical protein